MYVLNDLYRFCKKRDYIDHSLKIAKEICRAQIRNHPDRTEWNGGYIVNGPPPRTTTAACRSEDDGTAADSDEVYGYLIKQPMWVPAIGFDLSFGIHTGWFGLDTDSPFGYCSNTGYPGVYDDETGPRMTNSYGLATKSDNYHVLEYDTIGTNPGNSGGPIWYADHTWYYIAGVSSTKKTMQPEKALIAILIKRVARSVGPLSRIIHCMSIQGLKKFMNPCYSKPAMVNLSMSDWCNYPEAQKICLCI